MKEPIYKVIENHVRELINSDSLKEGDLIPSEKQLSEEFNVTRMGCSRLLQTVEKCSLLLATGFAASTEWIPTSQMPWNSSACARYSG